MLWPAIILLALLITASALMLTYWCAVGYHVVRAVRLVPTARAGMRLPEATAADLPSVCVVVPAHNEESCIALITRSLLAQDYPSLRVVFSLDRCTDRTLEILTREIGADSRFQIIQVSQCPPEWIGKTHAIWRGVQESEAARSAEVILFADADTILDPGCIRATVALLRNRGLAMLSLLSTLTNDKWFEKVIQTAAGMELIRQYPLVRANARVKRRPFANGQYIMVTQKAYRHIGGHESIKSALLEDVHLARQAANKGLPGGLFLADGMLHCRMYSDYAEFRRGWRRIYSEAANRRTSRLRGVALRTRLLGTIMPLAAAGSVAAGLALGGVHGEPMARAAILMGVAALAVFYTTLSGCYVLARTPLWTVLAYPIGAWEVGSIMLDGAKALDEGAPTIWGGREYAQAKR
jgi:glycosyltransferase involved in cell wall biosynthesis